jgi:hypothetical protein
MYQARKAKTARTMITIAVYLIAAYPARPGDSGSGLWVIVAHHSSLTTLRGPRQSYPSRPNDQTLTRSI